MSKSENVTAFLEEYAALCERYGIIVSACGCCGSPFLVDDLEQYGSVGGLEQTAKDVVDKNVAHLRDEYP